MNQKLIYFGKTSLEKFKYYYELVKLSGNFGALPDDRCPGKKGLPEKCQRIFARACLMPKDLPGHCPGRQACFRQLALPVPEMHP